METSVSIHDNGSYFTEQLARGQQHFNPFAVLGLFPKNIFLAQFSA